MRLTKSFIITFFYLFLVYNAQAQPSQVKTILPKVTSASPEATAFSRYGNYAVNMYSGLPDISIPLYEIKVGEIEIPISISYHASGVKVTDPGSWVGLSWSLNAGGMITRKLMGKPDEGQGNYLRGSTVRTIGSINVLNADDLNYLRDVYRGNKDCDPDIFTYNIGNRSGKFVYNQNDITKPVIIPYSPILVNTSFSGDQSNIDIVDDGGVLYRFDEKEYTLTCTSDCPGATSAWKPSKIISANKQDTIFFNYNSRYGQISNDYIDYITMDDQITDMGCNAYSGSSPQSYSSSITVFSDEKNLSEIIFLNGKVVFETNPVNRTDINGSKILQKIKVYNLNATGAYQLIKTIVFYQSYFSSNQVPPGQGRLKLDSLKILDNTGSVIENFRFEYNAPTLPVLNTRARDYWGYYNAKNNNILVPNMQIDIFSGSSSAPLTIGSTVPNSREPDPLYNQNCMLKRIYFPTGGYTEFEFETNSYFDQITSTIKNGGGLRVKSIKSYDGINTTPLLKTYKYGENESGYGRANFTLKNNFFTSIQNNRYMSSAYGNGIPSLCSKKRVRTFLSNSTIDLEPYDGASVAYPKVTEYTGDASGQWGKTIYEYTDFNDGLSSTMITGKAIITSYHFDRGLLHTKTEYKKENGQYITVSKINNRYNAFPEYFVQNLGIVVSKKEINDVDALSDVDLGPMPPSGGVGVYDSYNYNFVNYSIRTGDNKLVQTIQTDYDQIDVSKTIVTTIDYDYENFNHQQVTKLNSASSDGSIKTIIKKYPHEFSTTAPYNSMISQNIINKVVEELSMNNTTQIAKQLNNYSNAGNGNYLPATIQLQKGSHPLETRAEILQYDKRGNVLEMRNAGDKKQSYIWDYKNSHPIAMIDNAGQSDIAFTSFETAQSGGWTLYNGTYTTPTVAPFAPTGKRYFNLSGTIPKLSRTVISGKKYRVSYWRNTSTPFSVSGGTVSVTSGPTINGWTLHDHIVNTNTTNIEIIGPGAIDEVRLYPVEAQMTTNTFEPLIGMTSQTDANNRTTYYEYDELGRLKLVKDEVRNILKKYCYNFFGQPDFCDANAIWQITGTTRCKPCPANASYITNILQNQEKDINPQSPSYNTLRWNDAGTSTGCIITADWQNTTTAVRCKKNANNQNTGEQEQEQKDLNPCSGTYNQLRWIVIGTNTSMCPLPVTCNTSNCTGEDRKCIGGVCTIGVKVFTDSWQVHGSLWECIYHYEWGPDDWSPNYRITQSSPCLTEY